MTDIVYVLDRGSTWKDNELRFSLRSVYKNLEDIGRIFIVGYRPTFLRDVFHIPVENAGPYKETNIFRKIQLACDEKSLSEEFLFMNDDHFLNSKGKAGHFLPYYFGALEHQALNRSADDPYGIAIRNTISALKSNNLPTRYFDVHCPIVYSKTRFNQWLGKYDWTIPQGYVIKSLYSNEMYPTHRYPEGIMEKKDCKIDGPVSWEQLQSIKRDRNWFSVGPYALNSMMEDFLRELYPHPSPWETIGSEQLVIN